MTDATVRRLQALEERYGSPVDTAAADDGAGPATEGRSDASENLPDDVAA